MLRQDDPINTAIAPREDLTPDQVYLTAIGMFDAAGYTCQLKVINGTEPLEYARVYEKDHVRHVLYFPGTEYSNSLPRTPTIHEIVNAANAQITKHFHLDATGLEIIHKHYLMLDSSNQGHFIYGSAYYNEFTTTDTLPNSQLTRMQYDESHFDSLHPTLRRQRRNRATFNQCEKWKSGHRLLLELWEKINDTKPLNYTKHDGVTEEVINQHEAYFVRGKHLQEQTNRELAEVPTEPVVLQNKPLIKKSFFPLPKAMKSILAGVAIGLVIAGFAVLCVYTLGGAGALVAGAAFVGGACGFTGSGAIAFGICFVSGIIVAAVAAINVYKQYSNSKNLYRHSLPYLENTAARSFVSTNVVAQRKLVTLDSAFPPPPAYGTVQAMNMNHEQAASEQPLALPIASDDQPTDDSELTHPNSPR